MRANYRIDLEHIWPIWLATYQTFLDRVTVNKFHKIDDVLLSQRRSLDLVHRVEDVSGAVVLHLRLGEGKSALRWPFLGGQAILAWKLFRGDFGIYFFHDATELILDNDNRVCSLFGILLLFELVLLVLLDHFQLDVRFQLLEVGLRVLPQDSHLLGLLGIPRLLHLLLVSYQLRLSHIGLFRLALVLRNLLLNLFLALLFVEFGETAQITRQLVVNMRVYDRLCGGSHG